MRGQKRASQNVRGRRQSAAGWLTAPYRWREERRGRERGEDNTERGKRSGEWGGGGEEEKQRQSDFHEHTHLNTHSLTVLCLPSYFESSFPLADKSTNTTITIITSTSSAAPRWASAGKGARGSSPRWLAISIASSWERSPKVGIQKLPLPHPEVRCWVCWARWRWSKVKVCCVYSRGADVCFEIFANRSLVSVCGSGFFLQKSKCTPQWHKS